MSRREYPIHIKVNGTEINKVIVDPHFEEKHLDTINDEIILGLTGALDGKYFEPVEITHTFMYFVTDMIFYQGKKYKLVWVIEKHQSYIGVVNAYRR